MPFLRTIRSWLSLVLLTAVFPKQLITSICGTLTSGSAHHRITGITKSNITHRPCTPQGSCSSRTLTAKDIDSHQQPLPSNQFPRPWLHLHSGGDGKTDRDSEIEEHPATRYLHRRKRLHTPLAIPPTQNHNSMCLYPVVSATWWSFRREMCRLQDFGRGNGRVKHKYTAHCLASRVPTLSSLPPRFSHQSRKYYTLPTA